MDASALDDDVVARFLDGDPAIRWQVRRNPPLPGEVWCELEPPGPGRWTTLRALRVQRWWDGDGSD